MNFDLSDEQLLLLEQVDHACRELRPHEDRAYLERRLNEQLVPVLRRAKLLGLPVSREFGEGQGADILTYALALERIGQEGSGVRTFLSGHISLTQLTIQRWGTKEQQERFLPKATRGELVMAFALTEPTAGSDPASLKTTFEERDGQYVLNGSKAWISNGSIADVVIAFAYPRGRTEGMCAFLVERGSEGFSAREQRHKMGLVTSDTGQLYFDKCLVPRDNLLGPPSKGLSIAYSALMNGRLSVAAGCVGVIEDCIREATNYARQRVQHSKPIGRHQLVQRHLAIMLVNLEAARLLTYKAALAKMKYEARPSEAHLRDAADQLIAQAKYFAANAAYDAADRAVQIFGANGYSFENRPARHLCDNRVCRIYEGTDEILQLKIALQALGKDFEAFS
jgi:alkylation response protein AidB-like acyl-CoA dehydrogenase